MSRSFYVHILCVRKTCFIFQSIFHRQVQTENEFALQQAEMEKW